LEWDNSIEYDQWHVSCGLDKKIGIDIDTIFSVAKPFEEVQKEVNDLLDGRILIGHAVHHDLKVLICCLNLCG
jgi:DNA polymerase III epsilon subunit-like protein